MLQSVKPAHSLLQFQGQRSTGATQHVGIFSKRGWASPDWLTATVQTVKKTVKAVRSGGLGGQFQ